MTAILESIEADYSAFEQIASITYELYVRVIHVRDSSSPAELDARTALAADLWEQLDELGVDLRLDDLKTAIAVRTAIAPQSGGAAPYRWTSALWEERVDSAPLGVDRRAM